MGKLLAFPDIKPKEALAPLDWRATIENKTPYVHICKQEGRIQSPHHPNVWIELSYGKPPVFHGANGTTFQPDAVEMARYLLEWMAYHDAH